jgi:hypothetical protein
MFEREDRPFDLIRKIEISLFPKLPEVPGQEITEKKK